MLAPQRHAYILERLRGDGAVRVAPEYEACRMIAVERNIPILEVYQAVERAADKVLPS